MVTRRPPQDRSAQYEDMAFRALVDALAYNVRQLRERLNLTQEDAAERCSMDVRMLQLIESAGTNPTFTTLARLTKGFRVSAAELLGNPDRRKETPRGVARTSRQRSLSKK